VKQITKTTVGFLIVGFLAMLGACTVMGCNSSQAVASEDYQKLPPGEGARRLQDTLKRRAAGQARSAPLPANVRVEQQP
jgi:hypothetical protein